MKIKLIELFAGVGSQTQALKDLGIEHEVVGISEIDKYAITAYEAIHGKVNNFGDITKIEKLPYCDILTYSFPCQDVSNAGHRAGIVEGETRSGLLYEVIRLLNVSEKPKYLIMENVKALTNKRNMSEFLKLQETLSMMGYNNYWQVMNAKDYGIPQNRERVIMVSVRNDVETTYKFPQPQRLTKKLYDLVLPKVEEKYYITDAQLKASQKSTYRTSASRLQLKEYADTLCARDYKDPKLVMVGMLTSEKYDKLHDIGRRVYSIDGISPTLHTNGGGNLEAKIETQDNRYRKLTPQEYWRLMGFSDVAYTKARQALIDTYHNGKDRANSQLYKLAGNSIVVDVLKAVFNEMIIK